MIIDSIKTELFFYIFCVFKYISAIMSLLEWNKMPIFYPKRDFVSNVETQKKKKQYND